MVGEVGCSLKKILLSLLEKCFDGKFHTTTSQCTSGSLEPQHESIYDAILAVLVNHPYI